jgi:hypothetical protein
MLSPKEKSKIRMLRSRRDAKIKRKAEFRASQKEDSGLSCSDNEDDFDRHYKFVEEDYVFDQLFEYVEYKRVNLNEEKIETSKSFDLENMHTDSIDIESDNGDVNDPSHLLSNIATLSIQKDLDNLDGINNNLYISINKNTSTEALKQIDTQIEIKNVSSHQTVVLRHILDCKLAVSTFENQLDHKSRDNNIVYKNMLNTFSNEYNYAKMLYDEAKDVTKLENPYDDYKMFKSILKTIADNQSKISKLQQECDIFRSKGTLHVDNDFNKVMMRINRYTLLDEQLSDIFSRFRSRKEIIMPSEMSLNGITIFFNNLPNSKKYERLALNAQRDSELVLQDIKKRTLIPRYMGKIIMLEQQISFAADILAKKISHKQEMNMSFDKRLRQDDTRNTYESIVALESQQRAYEKLISIN